MIKKMERIYESAEEIRIEEFANDFNGKSKDRFEELAKKIPWSVKTPEEMAEIEKRWMKMIWRGRGLCFLCQLWSFQRNMSL